MLLGFFESLTNGLKSEPDLQGLVVGVIGVLQRDVLLHDLEQSFLLSSGEALDHPEVGVLDARKQGLLGDLVRHLFATLPEPGQSLGILVVPVPVRFNG